MMPMPPVFFGRLGMGLTCGHDIDLTIGHVLAKPAAVSVLTMRARKT